MPQPPTALRVTPTGGGSQPSHARLSGREFLVLGLRPFVIPSQPITKEFSLDVNSVGTYRGRLVEKSISNRPQIRPLIFPPSFPF